MNYNNAPSDLNNGVRVTTNNVPKEEAYWDKFYSGHELPAGSTFFEAVSSYPELPDVIIDIGCGDGRDSFAFAGTGKYVLGLDRSGKGVEHGRHRAHAADMEDRLAFEVCDVSSTKDLASKLYRARQGSPDGRICIYMRFFLHSIDQDVQDSMLQVISARAEEGDFLAAEFRTDKDEERAKTFGVSHFRRYQNAEDFSKKLQEDYNWRTLFEVEDKGLSPYGDEDPILYRVIATK